MDKKKKIEEMAKVIQYNMCKDTPCEECNYHGVKYKILPRHCSVYIHAEMLYNAGYRKIKANEVVLTEKEYKRYTRIEKIIKLAKMEKANGYEVKNGKLYYFSNMLGGCEIEFKDLQDICDMANHYNEEFWGLDQRITFWQLKAEETRKETAEKFAERVKWQFVDSERLCEQIDEICKEIVEGENG